MSWNPSELTDEFGQKVGQYAASQFSHGQGSGGFLGEAQNKLVGQQVGSYVTNEVNQLFHIQPSSGVGHHTTNDPSQHQSGGGFSGEVKNFASNEVNQFFHHGSQPEAQHIPPTQQHQGGFMGGVKDEFNQVFHSGHSGAGSAESHIPSNQRVGQGMSYGTQQQQQQGGGWSQQASNFVSKEVEGFFQ